MTDLRTDAAALDVAVGTELPTFERTTDFAHWNRYAAVNDEFIDVHMSTEAAQAAGQPDVFGMGNLRVAYVHALLADWLDDRGDISAFSCQFRALNFRADPWRRLSTTPTRRYFSKRCPPPAAALTG